VTPGDYRVDLVVEGEVVDSKSMTIHMDPEVPLVGTERMAYDNILMDLHEMQREGTAVAADLTRLYRAMESAEEAMEEEDVSGEVERAFADFKERFDEVRPAFGVPLGGGRFGGGSDDNALARVAGVKSSIGAFWETPSDALVSAYYDAKAAMAAALPEAAALMEQARALAGMLAEEGITLEVPGGM
jgi:hypothetical protein